MRKGARLALIAAAIVTTLSTASAAFAAPQWSSMDVTILEDQGQTVLMVAGQLPNTATLPARIQLPVPKGLQPTWVGELMGSSGQGDIRDPYKKTTVGSLDIYTFTLTKSRLGQVEGIIPPVTTFDGTNYAVEATWTPFADAAAGRMSMRLPATAKITSIPEGGKGVLIPSDAQYSYFSRSDNSVKKGKAVTLRFSYVLETPVTKAKTPNALITMLFVLAGLAAIALVIAVARQKKPHPA